MKVLHIAGDSKFGGGSVIILSLVRMALSNGWSVDVLCTDSVFRKAVSEAGARVINLDFIRREIRPVFDLKGLLKLRAFLSNRRYHIVHTHTSKAGFIGRCAAYHASVPVILHTVHGFAFHPLSAPWIIGLYSFLEKLASRWCHRIITVSHFHREQALGLGIGHYRKVVAIPNGISSARLSWTEEDRQQLRRVWSISDAEIILTYIGRLAPQKGLTYLFEALPMIKRKMGRPFRLILIGDGEKRRPLEAKALEMGMEHQILFTGFQQKVGAILSLSDLIVLPSFREGLSISLIEAMAAGKAIVATTIPSNMEATDGGRAALLVPPKNSKQLAEAILKIGNDPLMAQSLSTRARKTFFDHYTEKKMIQRYEELYREYG